MTKPCRYCYSDVHRSAKICPICHNAQTTIGITKSLMMTVFPILTTIASLGIAYYEKVEKDAAVVELEREKLSATAAYELADELSESLTDSQLATTYYSVYQRVPTKERLKEVEQIVKAQKEKRTLSKDELVKLNKERKELRLMFKRSGTKKRKKFNSQPQGKNMEVASSVQPSAVPRVSGFQPSGFQRSRVVPANGNLNQGSRFSNNGLVGNQGQPVPQSRAFTPGRLQQTPKTVDQSATPRPININGKLVTPLVNLPQGMIKELQKNR